MVNLDTIVAIGLIHDLAAKTEMEAVPLSKIRSIGEVRDKIVYDDSKPEIVDKNMCYPVVYSAHISGEKREAKTLYDDLLSGIKVRYYIFDTPDFNFFDFLIVDDNGDCVDLVIEHGSFYLAGS